MSHIFPVGQRLMGLLVELSNALTGLESLLDPGGNGQMCHL